MRKRIIIRRRAAPATTAKPRTASAAQPRTAQLTQMDNVTFKGFNPALLGLGDISLPSKEVEAIAVVLDLSGFTKFCNQVDPHLAVPLYLSQYLGWLFDKIKIGLTVTGSGDQRVLWAELPFLSKFLGDGLLFLWNTRDMKENVICDIVSTLHDICYSYKQQFYPMIKRMVASPPDSLRCGIARGRVFSVGNGKDYVGHCINLASRLQKVSLLTFCFPRRGFDVPMRMRGDLREKVVEKRVSIRGIWESDLVWVLKEEFDSLPDKEKAIFGEP